MNDNDIQRKLLVNFLDGHQAHMTFAEAIKDFPMDQINALFPNGTYSSWALLEHIRITQKDILDFILDPDYKEPEWPKDYWPAPAKKATAKDWDKTVSLYASDLEILKQLVLNPETDLYKVIPWGDGQTVLREIILVIDHSSYHIGELAIMRQTLQTWGRSRH